MSENELKLYFDGKTKPELIETHFKRGTDNSLHLCVRGRAADSLNASGSFQWTTAVKALSALFIRIALSKQSDTLRSMSCLSGHKGSLASSLDYALSKQPVWLQEMFGMGSYGTVYARRIILRTNSERKRPGPVILGLNTVVLKPESIQIFLNNELVTGIEALTTLLMSLGENESALVLPEADVVVCDLAA